MNYDFDLGLDNRQAFALADVTWDSDRRKAVVLQAITVGQRSFPDVRIVRERVLQSAAIRPRSMFGTRT